MDQSVHREVICTHLFLQRISILLCTDPLLSCVPIGQAVCSTCQCRSWLSTCLQLESTESQAVGYTCETFNPELLRWEDLPIILATPSAENLYKGYGRRKRSCLACLLSPHLKSIPSRALEASSFRALACIEGQLQHPAS